MAAHEGTKRVYAPRRRGSGGGCGARCSAGDTVFRRMFSQPVGDRIDAKRAAKQLRLSEAAAQLAEQVQGDLVQAHEYTEGYVAVTMLDSAGPP